MLTFYTSADTLIAEQDQFEKDIEEFKIGNINPVKFKAIRAPDLSLFIAFPRFCTNTKRFLVQ